MALATLYLQGGQAARSVTIAESLAKQRPGSPGVQNLLGRARAAAGDRAGAKAAFESAAKLDASFSEPQVNLARLDTDAKAFDAAATRLTAVLAKNQKNLDAITEMARLLEGAASRPKPSAGWRRRSITAGRTTCNRISPWSSSSFETTTPPRLSWLPRA